MHMYEGMYVYARVCVCGHAHISAHQRTRNPVLNGYEYKVESFVSICMQNIGA